jgi:arginyl-tRNA synthetase
MIYVVSEQQKLHFQLLFAVLAKMGESWANKCEHVSFGTVFFGEDKLSTRQGNVLFLESVLNEAKKRALELCLEKNPELPNKEEVAEKVGIGAILFGELTTHRQRDFEFKWEHILTFEGETGPYIQYTVVRCNSLLNKISSPKITSDFSTEWTPEEEALLSSLSRFQESLLQVVKENEPFYITKYLSELAKAFNRFYYKVPVIQCTNNELKLMRISLVLMTKQVLENGLKLLGIECPQEM